MKYYIGVLFLSFLFSCSQLSRSPQEDCLGTPVFVEETACPEEWDEEKFCEVRYGGKFVLTEESKSYLPLYCDSVGTSIVFTNGVGDDQIFQIVEKGYVESNEMIALDGFCSDSTNRRILSCIENERAFVTIESELHKFVLSVLSAPDSQDPTPGNIGDFFQVSREIIKDSDFYVKEWKSVIDRRTLSYDMEPCTQFYPNMVLNGTPFENVTGFEEQGDCANYRYYINNEFGLVGFSRSDGILWSLK